MNQAPTKAEEIEALRSFADQYPKNSYLGSFLRALVPLMAQELRSDTIPSMPAGTLDAWKLREQQHALAEVRAEIGTLREQQRAADAELHKTRKSNEEESARIGKIRENASADLARAMKYVNQEMI